MRSSPKTVWVATRWPHTVTVVTIPGAVVADAGLAARTAAERCGLRVAELTGLDQFARATELVNAIWQAGPGDEPVNVALLRAFAYAGNYVVGAYAGEQMVGSAVAFFGDRHLHSHITGVDRGAQSKGAGFTLKQHQRAWALRRGLTRICWTFDPLVRRNAYFNLVKLGASATRYLPDFYGPLGGLNAGDATDRLYVSWQLDSPAAIAAAAGQPVPVAPSGPRVLLGTTHDRGLADPAEAPAHDDEGAGGEEPVLRAEPLVGSGPLLVAVPEDVEALRQRSPETAERWRYAVREALVGAFGSGFRSVGMTGSGRYVLAPDRRLP